METRLKIENTIYTFDGIEGVEIKGDVANIFVSLKEKSEDYLIMVKVEDLVSFIEKEELNSFIEDYADYNGEHAQDSYTLDAETYLDENLLSVADLYVRSLEYTEFDKIKGFLDKIL